MPARGTLRRAILLSALLLGSAAALGAQETPGEALPVQDFTLENGLRLLILPKTGAPTVSFVVQYPIGSVNERPGGAAEPTAGLSGPQLDLQAGGGIMRTRNAP